MPNTWYTSQLLNLYFISFFSQVSIMFTNTCEIYPRCQINRNYMYSNYCRRKAYFPIADRFLAIVVSASLNDKTIQQFTFLTLIIEDNVKILSRYTDIYLFLKSLQNKRSLLKGKSSLCRDFFFLLR